MYQELKKDKIDEEQAKEYYNKYCLIKK